MHYQHAPKRGFVSPFFCIAAHTGVLERSNATGHILGYRHIHIFKLVSEHTIQVLHDDIVL